MNIISDKGSDKIKKLEQDIKNLELQIEEIDKQYFELKKSIFFYRSFVMIPHESLVNQAVLNVLRRLDSDDFSFCENDVSINFLKHNPATKIKDLADHNEDIKKEFEQLVERSPISNEEKKELTDKAQEVKYNLLRKIYEDCESKGKKDSYVKADINEHLLKEYKTNSIESLFSLLIQKIYEQETKIVNEKKQKVQKLGEISIKLLELYLSSLSTMKDEEKKQRVLKITNMLKYSHVLLNEVLQVLIPESKQAITESTSYRGITKLQEENLLDLYLQSYRNWYLFLFFFVCFFFASANYMIIRFEINTVDDKTDSAENSSIDMALYISLTIVAIIGVILIVMYNKKKRGVVDIINASLKDSKPVKQPTEQAQKPEHINPVGGKFPAKRKYLSDDAEGSEDSRLGTMPPKKLPKKDFVID
jgi:hypothetical protein